MKNEVKTFHLIPGEKLEQAKHIDSLPIGHKIFAYGPGMDGSIYCVISLQDKHRNQNTVKVSQHYKGDYFSLYHNIESFIKPVSKKFGIGFYYDDKENFIFPEDQIKEFIKVANEQEEILNTEALAEATANEKERVELPSKFPHLIAGDAMDDKTTKKNLVSDLKKNFPGIKFSVVKRHYSAYSITWTNGPTTKEVDNITDKFSGYSFDWSGDFYDFTPSNFNDVFGSIKYISTSRDKTEEIEILCNTFNPKLDESDRNGPNKRQIFYRIFEKTNIPINAYNFKVEETEKQSGNYEDFYKITFEVPGVPEKKSISKGVEVVDYSLKAIAVIGDTKPLKDDFKAIGGRFNMRLTCGPGWIFPKTRLEQVNILVGV